jgi:hypothetical protein
VPNLASYGRDAPLFLVHPIPQHLLHLLSCGLILVLFLLRILDKDLGPSVLRGGTLFVVGGRRGRIGG